MAIKNLPEGILNHIKSKLGVLSKEEEALALERYSICLSCEHIKTDTLRDRCGLCGCYLDFKTKVKKEECKIKKW